MEKVFKISLKTVADKMSGKQMRMIKGGYSGGSGTYDDPYQLAEVVIDGNSKTQACAGASRCDICHYVYNKKVVYGRCSSVFGQPLHCSDLNCYS
jgi:hypothetical protein